MNTQTFKYGLNVPISGSHKLTRFTAWAASNAPAIAYRLPPQAPIATTSLTIRLRSHQDREQLQALLTAEIA